MKSIEVVYGVLIEQDGEEQICGFGMNHTDMQCVSSKRSLIEDFYEKLSKLRPEDKFVIAEFVRKT